MVTGLSYKPELPTLIVISGPTAVGKTDVAIEVAMHFGCEIISADSRQFYHGLPIGTAAPDQAQLARVKHHFIGNLDPSETYNVSRYEKEALQLLGVLFQKNKVAVLCGGSGLYIRSICHGIDDLPDSDPQIRADLQHELNVNGLQALRLKLQRLDPEYYKSVDPANPARILRALEVCLTTGKPFSSFRVNQVRPRNFNILFFALNLPRETLHKRINSRVDQMISQGLIGEATENYSKRDLNALNTVGYKEIFAFIDGDCSLDDAIEKIKTNTRRYARRQITWLKREENVIWCSPDSKEVLRIANDFLSGQSVSVTN